MHKIKVISNFVSDEDCSKGIELLKTLELSSFKNNPDASVAPATDEVMDLVKKYSEMAVEFHKENNNLQIPIYTFEGFLTHWKTGAVAPVHIDNHVGAEYTQLSTVLYLNDDYEGGEIYFPEFDFSHKPLKGDGIFFPAFSKNHSYEHGVTEITKGNRYTIGMWHTQFEKYANPDFA